MAVRVVLVLAAVGLLGCAGCSSGSTTGSAGSGTGSGGVTRVVAGHSSSAAAASARPAPPAGGAGITITGAFDAKVTVTLCAAGGASIVVHVAGDPQKYLGVISGKAFAFVGPGAADYSLASGQAKPVASSGDTRFTVTDAQLVDLVSGKKITASGTVSCP